MPRLLLGSVLVVFAFLATSGQGRINRLQTVPIGRAPFGVMPDGRPIEVFTLKNGSGLEVRVINYGAIIQSIRVPDRNGRFADVVNGHDSLEGYLTRSRFFGAVVGRYGNRIAKGKFSLDGKEYSLAVNNGPNHLHGGVVGFDKVVWTPSIGTVDSATSGKRPRALQGVNSDTPALTLRYVSPDGDEGYPGRLDVRVTYAVSISNELVVFYQASTDKPTIVNLTQHSYFNLAGHDSGDIGRHVLILRADRYTPVDSTQIPTGAIEPVEGTPFDFRKPTPISSRIDADNEQLRIGGGYDHNFVLNRNSVLNAVIDELVPAVLVVEPTTGRTLTVRTTEPGIQFYSGNKLDGSITGKGGAVYGRRSGLCLETQHFPDSPNHSNFPSTVLRPGATRQSVTVLGFGIQR